MAKRINMSKLQDNTLRSHEANLGNPADLHGLTSKRELEATRIGCSVSNTDKWQYMWNYLRFVGPHLKLEAEFPPSLLRIGFTLVEAEPQNASNGTIFKAPLGYFMLTEDRVREMLNGHLLEVGLHTTQDGPMQAKMRTAIVSAMHGRSLLLRKLDTKHIYICDLGPELLLHCFGIDV